MEVAMNRERHRKHNLYSHKALGKIIITGENRHRIRMKLVISRRARIGIQTATLWYLTTLAESDLMDFYALLYIMKHNFKPLYSLI